jgi:hypothetical protein
MGCVTNDTAFVGDKRSFGDYDPAHYAAAVRQAVSAEVPYVAVARRDTTADGFTFARLTATPSVDLPGCVRPCLDAATQSCGSMERSSTANARRVWAVYRLLAGVPKGAVLPYIAASKRMFVWVLNPAAIRVMLCLLYVWVPHSIRTCHACCNNCQTGVVACLWQHPNRPAGPWCRAVLWHQIAVLDVYHGLLYQHSLPSNTA